MRRTALARGWWRDWWGGERVFNSGNELAVVKSVGGLEKNVPFFLMMRWQALRHKKTRKRGRKVGEALQRCCRGPQKRPHSHSSSAPLPSKMTGLGFLSFFSHLRNSASIFPEFLGEKPFSRPSKTKCYSVQVVICLLSCVHRP